GATARGCRLPHVPERRGGVPAVRDAARNGGGTACPGGGGALSGRARANAPRHGTDLSDRATPASRRSPLRELGRPDNSDTGMNPQSAFTKTARVVRKRLRTPPCDTFVGCSKSRRRSASSA